MIPRDALDGLRQRVADLERDRHELILAALASDVWDGSVDALDGKVGRAVERLIAALERYGVAVAEE